MSNTDDAARRLEINAAVGIIAEPAAFPDSFHSVTQATYLCEKPDEKNSANQGDAGFALFVRMQQLCLMVYLWSDGSGESIMLPAARLTMVMPIKTQTIPSHLFTRNPPMSHNTMAANIAIKSRPVFDFVSFISATFHIKFNVCKLHRGSQMIAQCCKKGKQKGTMPRVLPCHIASMLYSTRSACIAPGATLTTFSAALTLSTQSMPR